MIVFLGLGVRALIGPGPSVGRALNRAARLADAGRVEAARETLRGFLAGESEDPRVLRRAGEVLARAGSPLEATVLLSRAAEADSSDYRVRYELAKAYMAAGYAAHAESTLAGVIERKPDHADALYLGAALAAREGRVVATTLALARALASGPSDPGRYRWDPSFDPVRNDARFVRAVRSMTQARDWYPEDES